MKYAPSLLSAPPLLGNTLYFNFRHVSHQLMSNIGQMLKILAVKYLL